MLKTVDWQKNQVVIIDQTKLPEKLSFLKLKNYKQILKAIKMMQVRGAPALGVTAALGVVLGALAIKKKETAAFTKELARICRYLKSARPTAVNLFWGIDRILNFVKKNQKLSLAELKILLLKEARQIIEADTEANLAIGRWGQQLIGKGARVLTHCNAGSLATVAYGTALGVIRAARKKIKMVYADETRPRLQGGKLTAWELMREKIPVTVICDNMAGMLMKQGAIDLVVVGADRIAANGDTANKIGTYSLAVLAKHHKIPFYVAAPVSTIDFKIKNGSQIPIEQRDFKEVTHLEGRRILAPKVKVINPAFDLTPHFLITNIITEKGIFKPIDLAKLKPKNA